MDALGHQRFAVVGTDTGLPISYALAADHPDRVERVALAEVPGPPGAVPSPPFFVPEPLNNRLWHIAVNRLDEVNEQLVRGREDIYFGYEFAIQAGKKLPDDVINYYVGLLTNPDSLRGTFAFYREWDTMMAQNEQRKNRPLTMPVLGIGGAASYGDAGRQRDEAPRERRAERGHSRRRPLVRRGGPRGDGGGTDRVPGPVPRRSGRGARRQAACCAALSASCCFGRNAVAARAPLSPVMPSTSGVFSRRSARRMLMRCRRFWRTGLCRARNVEVEAVEGRPPKTVEVPDDKGGVCRYCLAEWTQEGMTAAYTFLYAV